jgi:TPP-dependent trihydroxycyclohexane-1,2-dione (THcHDO) dehydratase
MSSTGASTDPSTPRTQAQLESTVAHHASTVNHVQNDIDLCVNLQNRLQTERAALNSGVVAHLMHWRTTSEIDLHLKELSAKKADRETMLTEAKASLQKATEELEAHKKSFGEDDRA